MSSFFILFINPSGTKRQFTEQFFCPVKVMDGAEQELEDLVRGHLRQQQQW